nr:unnamed protein product [Digitaria exilis]
MQGSTQRILLQIPTHHLIPETRLHPTESSKAAPNLTRKQDRQPPVAQPAPNGTRICLRDQTGETDRDVPSWRCFGGLGAFFFRAPAAADDVAIAAA